MHTCFSKFTFDGGLVARALKGPICTHEYSGGLNRDHSSVVGLIATTIAHSLGHNFGKHNYWIDKNHTSLNNTRNTFPNTKICSSDLNILIFIAKVAIMAFWYFVEDKILLPTFLFSFFWPIQKHISH